MLSQERLPLQFRSAQLPPDITPFVLAKDEVGFVGEAVAVVIARDALSRRRRRRAGRGRLRAAAGGVGLPRGARSRARRSRTAAARAIVMTEIKQSYGDVAAAFARAPHRASVSLKQHRGGAHSIEGRGALAVLRRQRGPADAVDLDPARPRGARLPDASAAARREPDARGGARRRRRLRRQVRHVSGGGGGAPRPA